MITGHSIITPGVGRLWRLVTAMLAVVMTLTFAVPALHAATVEGEPGIAASMPISTPLGTDQHPGLATGHCGCCCLMAVNANLPAAKASHRAFKAVQTLWQDTPARPGPESSPFKPPRP